MYSSGELIVGCHTAWTQMQSHLWGGRFNNQSRSAVCGGFLSFSGYKPLLVGNGKKKMCLCIRNITFIISCQFQTGLRILKTLFDFYVFLRKSLLEKNSHCTCFVFRCLWQHYLKSVLDAFYFFGDVLTLPDTESLMWNSDLVRLQQWKI